MKQKLFKCNEKDCGMVFASHQALGGHRSSHNKLRMTIINTHGKFPSSNKNNSFKKRGEKKEEKKNEENDASTFDLNMPAFEEEEGTEMTKDHVVGTSS